MQNATSANQNWASTNLIGRFGVLDVIYSVDVGRLSLEKPDGKESKGRKGLYDYE